MDTLLGKLDEFEQLMVLSQSDANVCLFKHVPGLQTKFTEMQSVFDKIDRYVFFFNLVFLKLCKELFHLMRSIPFIFETVQGVSH